MTALGTLLTRVLNVSVVILLAVLLVLAVVACNGARDNFTPIGESHPNPNVTCWTGTGSGGGISCLPNKDFK